MADLSKLEVFKLNLGRTTFRNVALEKSGLDATQATNNQVFNSLYRLFLQKLTQDSVWTHNKIKMGLVLFANDGENVNSILTSHSDSFVIEGYIDGGPYDRIRNMSEKDDTTTKVVVDRNKIVTDRYYIYLYLPLDSSVGLLFLERKKGQDIHVPIELLLKEVLKNKCKCTVDRYIPKSLIDKYRTEGVIDSFTFSDSIVSPELGDDDIEQYENDFDVSICIKPKSDEVYRYDMMEDALSYLGNVVVKVGEQMRALSQFRIKKAKIRREHDSYNFVIGDDLKIRPSIEIEENVHDRERDILFRDAAFDMVNQLLSQIKPDVYSIVED